MKTYDGGPSDEPGSAFEFEFAFALEFVSVVTAVAEAEGLDGTSVVEPCRFEHPARTNGRRASTRRRRMWL
jgi:hypothetical protein